MWSLLFLIEDALYVHSQPKVSFDHNSSIREITKIIPIEDVKHIRCGNIQK